MALTRGCADAPEESGQDERARRSNGRAAPRRARSPFEQQVRDALTHVHDPGYLQTHPLVAVLRLDPGSGEARTTSTWSAGAALQQRLLGAIETLRPGPATGPAAARAERRHRLFSLRYVQALPVAAVQQALAVGESEYFREHRRGLQAVISLLRERCAVAEAAVDAPVGAPSEPSGGARRTNLPAPLTSFVGRERDLRGIGRALVGARGTAEGEPWGADAAPARLLTLTGAGGCGKTRLALQAAAGLLPRYPDGVWLADLGRIADPALVPAAVADAVGVREEPGHPLLETVLRGLEPKRLLLVLDNCEHVLDACAHLADAVLTRCAGVQILATSRQSLGIGGEVSRSVPSLRVPPVEALEQAAPAGQLGDYDAVRLFVDRAAAVRDGFRLGDQAASAVAAICRQLDGLPLALELAAARVRALSVHQIAARLGDRFGLLTGGSRAALPRHRTLRAAVDWSYDLLPPAAQILFARLAVFADGFALEAAEAVCADGGGGRRTTDGWPSSTASGPSSTVLRPPDVLDLLAQLVDRSLVLAEPAGDREVRYRLLETLRQYARERLEASGDEAPVCQRHARYYLALAERADPELRGPQQGAWLDRLETEHPNLRQALRWYLGRGDAEAGLRLAAALWRFWQVRGYVAEGRERLAALLALPGAAGAPGLPSVRLRALNGAGTLARAQGDHAAARALHRQALATARDRGDRPGIADALYGLASVAEARGRFEEARALYGRCLARYRQADDRWGIAATLGDLGFVAHQQGHLETARALFEERLRLARALGDRRMAAWSLVNLAWTLLDRGDYAAAHSLYAESLAINRALGNRSNGGLAATLGSLGYLALAAGDHEAARARFDESLAAFGNVGASNSLARLGRVWLAIEQGDEAAARVHLAEGLREARQSGNGARLGRVLAGYAAAAAAGGRPERALRLAGWVRSRRPDPLSPFLQRLLDRRLEPARQALDEAARAAAWAQGRAMSPDQAVAYALTAEEPEQVGPSRPSRPSTT